MLDRYDIALAIASGIIAGVCDILLVGIPAHPGFLGGQGAAGGWLSRLIKEKTSALFPEDRRTLLEEAYRVPFDPSTSRGLPHHVAGLGPGSHRFQSLGHDPLLGFVFGVRDILRGEFSAISKDGHLIVQQVADPLRTGEHLVVRILEALTILVGHLASDVATPLGLPAPLMPLLQLLPVGSIGKRGYTIAEVARQMYRSGYDFRHFLAGSIPVMITEVIIRFGTVIRSRTTDVPPSERSPSGAALTLRRQLLLAHGVAMLVNAGKVSVTQNPLAISWPQVLAFLRYVLPELAFLMGGKEVLRKQVVETMIVQDYHRLEDAIDRFFTGQETPALVV